VSQVGILPDGTRVDLLRVCEDWRRQLLLPADAAEARRCLDAYGETANIWLGFPDFPRKVAQNLGYEYKTDRIPVDEWKSISKKFLDIVRHKHPELVGQHVYFLSIFRDGIVCQGAHASCSTVCSGFIDAEEFYCAFEFGDVDFYLGNGCRLLTDPRWFYTASVASLKEFQSNNLYWDGVYSFTAGLALSIIARYRAGQPSMEPPNREPMQYEPVPKTGKILKEIKDNQGIPIFRILEVESDSVPEGENP
jgi:hypothetical protein